ncbi:Hypothetical protein, putative [Bodo saltans]|uniref:HECT domain-containing protein n=1 Tax=Bodo saltans TaxID=75058 RepID=A0A0S4IMZ4_BODSA|nr:Hypothetical protein, putative [Bodo saltans]|eukprot:CUE75314.1 Hypothetical protein, putative [Bodo saltans]
MYNTDAVAVILPSSPSVPAIRTTLQQPHFALCLNEKRNCDGCVSQHRETKLSNANQEWFKCNDCVDYNLCGYCFGNFVHSHHPFTRMDGRLLVHTRLPPMGKLQAGATLVAPGTSVSYLKSIGCTMPEDAMSCVAVSAQPESMCTWGLIYSPQEDPSFTVNVKINDSPTGTVLSTNRPVFIGVGEASEILGATVEDLRKRCVTGFPTGVSMCSDSRVRRKLNFTSVSPHGFLTGSTITITVQLGQGRARLTRDWIDVGFVALPPNINPNSKLVGFVLFGSPNMTASVAPERAPHTLVTVVETISNELIRVSDSSNIHRFCSLQDCRVPMMAESGTPKVDMWYYAFLDNRLTTCRVAMVDKGEAVVFFPKRDSVQRVPTHHLFYPIFGDVPGNDDFVDYMDDDAATCGGDSSSLYGAGVAPSMPAIPTMSPNGSAGGALPSAHQTLITASSGGTAAAKSSSNNGPATMMDGFVMSRLMVILSCLMEDASLVPLLLTHAQTVLPLLHRLASVRIDSDAPTSFLPELRAAVASTTQVPRTQRLLNKPLAPFVPTTTPELEKTHAFPVKPNMLVAIIDGPLKGKLFRAQCAGTDTFRAEPLDGGAPATIKAAACVPVKQTAGRPWWRVSGGLPSSVLEHTLRSEVLPMHTNAKLLVSAEGEWHGELITAQNSNMSMSLSLRVDAMNWQITGTARVTIPDGRVIETAVRGTHHRYARTMRLACSYPTAGPHMTNDELRVGLRTFGVQATQEATRDDMIRKLASLCSHLPQPCWTLRGSVDAEGLRMSGTWKHTEGLSGTFSISSLRAVTLSALTTPFYHIEPLPNCVDMPIAAPQARDVYTVMHRLIVLLARHLYVSLIGRSGELAKEISKEIIHYHAHPLTERIIAFCVDTQPQRFYRILGEAITLMMDPKATPWDSSTLSAIITKSILLRPSTSATMPSVIWDALHAVVAAAHNCGEDHRHKVLDNVIQLIRGMAAHPPGGFLEDPTLPPPSLVGTDPTPTADLLTALCTWVDTQASTIVGIAPVRRDVAAGIELLLTIAEPLANRVATSVPLPVLRCLMDMAVSIQLGVPLPWAAEASSSRASADAQLPTLEVLCPFGQLMDGELKVGKVMSNLRTVSPHSGSNAATGAPPSSPQPPSKYYFEVVLPERTLAAFAVGWGTQQHSEIPSQHVGSDLHSFAFSGAQVVMKQVKEEYKFGVDIAAGAVVGCLLDLTEKTAAWSINGVVGPFIPVPILVADYDMHAYASTGSCSGLKIHMSAMEFLYVPDGYCDLAGRTSGVQVVSFDATRRSTIPVRPMSFYTHVASYLSDVEQALSSNLNSASSAAANSASAQQPPSDGGSAGQQTPSSTTQAIATPAVDSVANVATSPSSAGTAATAAIGGGTHNAIPSTSSVQHQHHQPQLLLPPHVEAAIRGRYSQLMSLTDVEISQCVSVIRVAESCMTTARRFIDLEGESVEGRLASAFLYMKQLVTRSFRRKLVEIPQVENNKSYNPPNATIRFTDLSSTFSRSNETALHHTILAQLHRQIGSFTPKQMLQNPMVRVHLYMTQSGHAPQDLGGPYRQMWSLLGDEMMTHPDSCYPHTDFHRNPLFRFANNSQRISLVPDHLASSTLELHLFTFLGKLMGHMARARSPLPVDISPFVWKFLVEDPLNVRDYYQHVDSVVEQSVNDEEFLRSEVAEDVIPNYADAISRETELYQIQQFQLQQQQHQQAHNNTAVQQHHHPFAPFGPQGSGTASAASSGSGIRALTAGHGGVVAAVLPTTNNTMGSMLASHQQTNNASRSDISLIYEDPDEAAILPFAVRRRVAEECLTHCMDLQLTALRTGLWSTLPKRVTRCLCWQDLERSVCGDASPTLEQMRDAVIVQAQHLREQFFWRLVEEMTGAQRSALLCFACGQKRLPLVKKVRVIENTESLEHLPRAQSCSALVTIPCYTSYDVFRAKVLSAIEHQSEMELA